MNKLLIAFLTLAVQISAFALKPSLTLQSNSPLQVPADPPKTVPYVNLTRYLGIWYEQAAIPETFQADCTNSFANYSLYDDGSLRVINTCYRKGEEYQLVGRAVPDPADTEHTNAKLKVRFPVSPADGDYWIVRLDESYSYVVVSGPTYNYLWILYRSPRIADALYDSIVQDLKGDGFPVERLRKSVIN